MSTVVKRVVGAVVGLAVVTAVGLFAVGVIDSLKDVEGVADGESEDYDD